MSAEQKEQLIVYRERVYRGYLLNVNQIPQKTFF